MQPVYSSPGFRSLSGWSSNKHFLSSFSDSSQNVKQEDPRNPSVTTVGGTLRRASDLSHVTAKSEILRGIWRKPAFLFLICIGTTSFTRMLNVWISSHGFQV